MAYKHQDQRYRTRHGVRYECVEDICDATFGDLWVQAKARVNELRGDGRKAFCERSRDGFYRVFVATTN